MKARASKLRTPDLTPLAGDEVLLQLRPHLEGLGFVLRRRANTGSFYFGKTGGLFKLRVSSHGYTTSLVSKKHPDVVTNFTVPPEGVTADRVEPLAAWLDQQWRDGCAKRYAEASRPCPLPAFTVADLMAMFRLRGVSFNVCHPDTQPETGAPGSIPPRPFL